MTRTDEIKAQIAQLDELIKKGVLKGNEARKARDKLEAQLVASVLSPAGAAAAMAPGQAGQPPASTPPSRRLLAGLATFVLLFSVAGYAWLGNPAALAVAPGSPAPAAAQAAAGGHEQGQAQFEAMTTKLAERLKGQPDDAEGWMMLGRSYTVLERYPQAQDAFKHALDLRPQDAQSHADYADAMGMANGRKLDGEPEKLIARALQLDPDNPKALGLAGTVAFDRGDNALAARHWERALAKVEPGSEMAQRLRGAVDEARQRAGLPALPPMAAAAGAPTLMDIATGAKAAGAQPAGQTEAPTGNPAATAAGASVQVRVSLAPALAAKAAPDDTVFIFARAMAGPKAPLAIQRKQVKDLPLDVTLDDSMAMSPAMRISTVAQVVVGARISKSGTAMPQPGDLQGLSPPVAVGTKGLKLEITDLLP